MFSSKIKRKDNIGNIRSIDNILDGKIPVV